MRKHCVLAVLAILSALPCPGGAQTREAGNALDRMPVREITVFKDGHAFVLHAGRLPMDDSGKAVMDFHPAPVLGTFWPFSPDP